MATLVANTQQVAEVNHFTNVVMAIGLIAVAIGVIITIVGAVALKVGLLRQSSFEPWKVLSGIWGTVLIVSIPGLVTYGSTLMTPPAKTNAQTVEPAYKTGWDEKVEFANSKSEEEIISIMGESNYQAAKEAMEEPGANSWDPKISWSSYDKMLIYRTGADGAVDPCMQIRLFYVPKGSTSTTFGKGKHLDFTHPDFSEEKCGGPVESYKNPNAVDG